MVEIRFSEGKAKRPAVGEWRAYKGKRAPASTFNAQKLQKSTCFRLNL
jgi:hypothetical protein